MASEETDRDQGVDFGGVDQLLADLDYPVSKSAFVDEHGDREIGRTNSEDITVSKLFKGTGEDSFESSEEVRQSILNLMPGDSVGRQRYSDRGGSTPAEATEDEAESL